MGIFFELLADENFDPRGVIKAFKIENNDDINAVDIARQTLLHWVIKLKRYDVLNVFLRSADMLNYNNLQAKDANEVTIYTLLSEQLDFLTSEKQFVEAVFFSNQSTETEKSYTNQTFDKNLLSAVELLFSKIFFPDNHSQAILALFRNSKLSAKEFIEKFSKIQPDIHANIPCFQENLLFVALKMQRYDIAEQLLDNIEPSTFNDNKKIENFKFVAQWIQKKLNQCRDESRLIAINLVDELFLQNFVPVIQKIIKTLTLPYLVRQILVEEIISETRNDRFIGYLLKTPSYSINKSMDIGYEIEFSDEDKKRIKDNFRYDTESDVLLKGVSLCFYLTKKGDTDFIGEIFNIRETFRFLINGSMATLNAENIINWLYGKEITQQEIANAILNFLCARSSSLEYSNWWKNHITLKDIFTNKRITYIQSDIKKLEKTHLKQLTKDCLLDLQTVFAKDYSHASATEFFENCVGFLKIFDSDSDIQYILSMILNFSEKNSLPEESLDKELQCLDCCLEFLDSKIQLASLQTQPSLISMEVLCLLHKKIKEILDTIKTISNTVCENLNNGKVEEAKNLCMDILENHVSKSLRDKASYEIAHMIFIGHIEFINGSEQTSSQKESVTLAPEETKAAKNTALLNQVIQAYQFLINNNLVEAKKLKVRFDNILAGNFKGLEFDESSVWIDEACKIFHDFYLHKNGYVVPHMPKEFLIQELNKHTKHIPLERKSILLKSPSSPALSLLFKQPSDNTPASVDAINLPDNETNAPLFRSNSF